MAEKNTKIGLLGGCVAPNWIEPGTHNTTLSVYDPNRPILVNV